MLPFKKAKSQKKLDAVMLAINSMLAEKYTNKSTDEYKMKGDITRSPMYSDIERMVAELKTLKGYKANDADDMKTLFDTLHRPVFKTMVKEYMTDKNDKNTVFTSMFTIGYRLLVGELARIFASTESTPKGIVYKPNKISRKTDASQMIKLFNSDLEKKLNDLVIEMHKHPEESPVSESYLTMIIDSMIQECGTVDTVKEEDENVETVTEEDEVSGDNDTSGDDNSTDSDTDTVQEASLAATGAALTTAANYITATGASIGIIAAAVGVFAGLFKGINGLLKGFNPITDINYMFMDSYDKKIRKLANVSSMYDATKKAYDEYMKIPDAQRKKKVESKYMKDMEKYNITMNNLAAEIEHFNQRAQKESQSVVNEVEDKMAKAASSKEDTSGGDAGNTVETDDDFQF